MHTLKTFLTLFYDNHHLNIFLILVLMDFIKIWKKKVAENCKTFERWFVKKQSRNQTLDEFQMRYAKLNFPRSYYYLLSLGIRPRGI